MQAAIFLHRALGRGMPVEGALRPLGKAECSRAMARERVLARIRGNDLLAGGYSMIGWIPNHVFHSGATLKYPDRILPDVAVSPIGY